MTPAGRVIPRAGNVFIGTHGRALNAALIVVRTPLSNFEVTVMGGDGHVYDTTLFVLETRYLSAGEAD